MLVSDLISLSMRTAGILGVGQTPLPQDLTDAQNMLALMMMQWRQKRWLVYRLDYVLFPLIWGKQSYTIGPLVTSGVAPDVVVAGNARPANIQSCYLRQNVGSGPNSYPIDFPMRILPSRQSYDRLSLKFLQSWPSAIYYDPTIADPLIGVSNGTLFIWPVPVQQLFSLYIAYQQDIDWAVANAENDSEDLGTAVPPETELALMYNLALLLSVNYQLPPNQALAEAAKSSLNVLRQTNFALGTLEMPSALRGTGRLKNPMGGFYPELSAGIPYSVLS